MPRSNELRVDSIEITAAQTNLIDKTGLAFLIRYITKLGFFDAVNKRLPKSSSNSGCLSEVYFKTLWALQILYSDYNAPLSRIDDMRLQRGILHALKLKSMPTAAAVGDWLRRLACCERVGTGQGGCTIRGGYENGMAAMQELFCEVTANILKVMRKELGDTLDFDASCIYGGKICDEWMYNKKKGSMSYLGFIGRLCIMAELEPGNHSPNDNISSRVGSCLAFAQSCGVKINTVRSDAAGYQSDLINTCVAANKTFYIRASADSAVRGACERITDWRFQNVRLSKSQMYMHEMGTKVHCMNETHNAFTLVVKREPKIECASDQIRLPGLDAAPYSYWCIATNAKVAVDRWDDGLTPAQVEEIYNDHANIENRIKQIKSDAGIGRLPTSELGANRVYVYIMALLHNVFELFKHQCLPGSFKSKRLPTIIRELIAVPGKITVSSHVLRIDLPRYMKHLVGIFQGILNTINHKVRAFSIPASPPCYAAMIFRRN